MIFIIPLQVEVLGLTDGWRQIMQDSMMEEELILSAYHIIKLRSINHTLTHQLQHYCCFQWHMDYFLPVLPLLHTPPTLPSQHHILREPITAHTIPCMSVYLSAPGVLLGLLDP